MFNEVYRHPDDWHWHSSRLINIEQLKDIQMNPKLIIYMKVYFARPKSLVYFRARDPLKNIN
jgi:hypothetical protein